VPVDVLGRHDHGQVRRDGGHCGQDRGVDDPQVRVAADGACAVDYRPFVVVAAPGLAEQFADARDDLAAVQLDIGHELVVRQARHAVLQVEPGGVQGAQVRGDLLRDGFR